ncbi:MAG: carboxypeptidase-like regulatory domain-containing protein [Anaerolineae bacterium]|nr:carboxypeptidase-like regulatory domain-containing protein [Anaerolineae bacterium]
MDTVAHTYISSIDMAAAGCYYPYQVTMSPDESLVFVACSSSVAVINTATNTVIQNINLPASAYDIAFVQNGAYALVTVPDYSVVVVVSTTTFTIVNNIITSNPPERVAAHPYLDYAYVTVGYGGLVVIDVNTFSVVQNIALSGYAYDVIVSPDGQLIFASNTNYPAGLHVIDANTNTVVAIIPAPGSVYHLSITPDGETVFGGGGYNGIYVFDVPTLTNVTTIYGVGDAYNPVVNCTGDELYVGGGYNDYVPVVDIPGYTVTNYVSLGGYYGPRGIAICPDFAISGVALLPTTQINDAALGETAVHELTLVNATDMADSYDLTLAGHSWDSALSTSQVGPLQPGETVTFTVSVTVPLGADWYDVDDGTVNATSVTSPTIYTATAIATTQAYASAQISVTPEEFSSTQFAHEVVTQALSISNGNGITLTYETAARPRGLDVVAQLGHGRSDHEIQALLAQASQTEDEHNTGLPTIGRYTPEELRQLQGPVNILAWTLYTDYYEEYTNVLNAIAQYATYSLTETTATDPTELAGLLQQADVFLMPEQEYAGYSTMYNLGQSWQNALNDFLASGSTIVLMDHCNVTIGMLPGAGLMDITFYDCWGDVPLDVVNPDHPVTQGLPPSFIGMNGSVQYLTTSGQTLVAHQSNGYVNVAVDEIASGRVVLMGLDFYSYNDEMARLLANAVLWQGGDVSWLYTVPESGSVATNDTAVVNVVMDATNLQPGDYTANLQISHNDENQNTLLLPVTMTVQPTANMGWVEGTITDAGTGLPLQATLIAQGQPYTITSDANTGHYQLWLDAGSYTLQVSANGYVTETQSVNIVAQQGIIQDFDLVLNVPVIGVTHEDMAVALDVGMATSRVFTITNDGPALLEFDILKTATGYTPLAYVRDRLNLALPETAVTTSPAPGPLANVPTAVHVGGNPVLIIQDYYPWGIDSIQQILNNNGIAYDQVNSSYMATIDLSAYELVIIPSDQSFDFYNAWDANIGRFEAYVEAGGALWLSGTTQGETPLMPEGVVNQFGTDDYNDVLLPAHPWVAGVSGQISGSSASHNYFTNLSPGSQVVAQSTGYGQATLVDYGMGAGRIMLTGQTLEIAWWYNWDAAPILENSLLDMYVWQPGDVPWLIVEPISGTVSGYSSVVGEVIFDAAGLQPGAYTANMIIKSNDPVNGRVTIPVTMTVSPAAGMGRVMGTVTDLWTGDPLTATVQLVGVYTDTADPDYSIWADAGNYTLVASASGYMTGTYNVVIPANGVVVQDIALEPAQPRLEDMPQELVITAVPGHLIPHTFTLANTGPLPLDYTWHEVAPNLHQPETPVDLTGKVIMYDMAHGQGSLANYSTLATALHNAGALVTTNFAFPITANTLNNVDVLWVDCCGYTNWTFAELQVVNIWMEAGGAVLVHSESYPAAADVAGIYNITYDCCQYSYGTTTDISPHPTTAGVSAIYLDYSYYTLNYTAAANAVVRDTNGYAQAVAQEQNGGKMVVIDSSLFDNYRITQADNMLFAMNVMNWLAAPAYGDVPWLSVSPLSGAIAGHDVQEMTVMVDTTGLAIGTHEAVLALEHNDPAHSSPILLPVTVQVVAQTAAVTLTPMTTSGSGLPGTPVTYTLTVQNSGNGPDTFAISVNGGWTATPSIVTTAELMPGQSQQFTVVVQIPANADPDSMDDTAVTATSQFNTAIAQTVTLTTTATVVSSTVYIYLPAILKP